jgi:hypothetical protein
MSFIKYFIILAIPLSAMASPQFTNLSDDDMKDITKELGANFTHNSMMPASKMGTIFGFQVGLVGAQTATPKIHDIISNSGGSGVNDLYNAGVMGAIGIPFGVSFEAVIMPTLKKDDSSMKANSFAVKFNINDVIPVLPVNLALRGFLSDAEFYFHQTIAGTNAKIDNTTNVSGVQLLFSPQLPLVEPYIGVGLLSAKDKLEVSDTTGTVFAGTSSQDQSKTVSGTQFLAGIELNLVLFKLGAEYSNAFNTSRYGAKLAFGF